MFRRWGKTFYILIRYTRVYWFPLVTPAIQPHSHPHTAIVSYCCLSIHSIAAVNSQKTISLYHNYYRNSHYLLIKRTIQQRQAKLQYSITQYFNGEHWTSGTRYKSLKPLKLVLNLWIKKKRIRLFTHHNVSTLPNSLSKTAYASSQSVEPFVSRFDWSQGVLFLLYLNQYSLI